MENDKKPKKYLICTDDTVIIVREMTFAQAMKEARTFETAFTGLNVYICEVICNAAEV